MSGHGWTCPVSHTQPTEVDLDANFQGDYIYAKNLRQWLLPSKQIDDQIILQSHCIRAYFSHGVIILKRSNNSKFLYLKIYWNRQVFDLICASGISPGFFPQILNSVFESINMGVEHKLFLQLFLIGFCLFCSRIRKSQL